MIVALLIIYTTAFKLQQGSFNV